MVPVAGSAYTYSYATLGELIAWIIGWDLILEYAIGNVAVAISWANYFNTLSGGVRHPASAVADGRFHDGAGEDAGGRRGRAPRLRRSRSSSTSWPFDHRRSITIVLVWGIRESAGFNIWMVVIKLVVLGFFVFVELSLRQAGQLARRSRPTASPGSQPERPSCSSPTSASTPSRPRRRSAETRSGTCRSGSSARLIICTVIYIVVAAVFTGMIPYEALRKTLATEQAEPLTLAMKFVSCPAGWWASSPSAPSSRTRRCCSSSSSDSRGSSSPWPATGSSRRCSRRSTRSSGRRTSRRS